MTFEERMERLSRLESQLDGLLLATVRVAGRHETRIPQPEH